MSNFDKIIHSPSQLRACAAFPAARQVEFATPEQGLGMLKSLLSKQLGVLTDAGYATLGREPQPFDRPRTWVGFAPVGRKAYWNRTATLWKIIEEN